MTLVEERRELEEERRNLDLEKKEFFRKVEIEDRRLEQQKSLKKRYKDLIKIYHPDNVDGDNSLVVEINKEYDHLCQVLA